MSLDACLVVGMARVEVLVLQNPPSDRFSQYSVEMCGKRKQPIGFPTPNESDALLKVYYIRLCRLMGRATTILVKSSCVCVYVCVL